MAREKFDFEALKASGFKSNDRRYLAKAHNITFGFDPEDFETVTQIREKLCDSFKLDEIKQEAAIAEAKENGEELDEIATLEKRLTELKAAKEAQLVSNVTPIASARKLLPSLVKLPNLTGNGRWDGRMRKVKFIKADPNSSEDVITARWEQVQQDLINGMETDLIWPLWENVKAATDYTLEKEFDYEKSGKHKGRLIVTEKIISKPKYTIIDLGDVPGTENKPRDYMEYFQNVARETSVFKNVTRALIMKVYTILFGTIPITESSQMSDQDIRLKIAVSLGPEFEDLMSGELFGEAVGA